MAFCECHYSKQKMHWSQEPWALKLIITLFLQDLDRCVTVFKAQKDDNDQPWVYIGKQRAHYKTIHGKKEARSTGIYSL